VPPCGIPRSRRIPMRRRAARGCRPYGVGGRDVPMRWRGGIRVPPCGIPRSRRIPMRRRAARGCRPYGVDGSWRGAGGGPWQWCWQRWGPPPPLVTGKPVAGGQVTQAAMRQRCRADAPYPQASNSPRPCRLRPMTGQPLAHPPCIGSPDRRWHVCVVAVIMPP